MANKVLQYSNNILKDSGVLTHNSAPAFLAPNLSSSTVNTLVYTIRNGWVPTVICVLDDNNVGDIYRLTTNYEGWYRKQDVSCSLNGNTITIQTQNTIHTAGIRFYNYIHIADPGCSIASINSGVAIVNSRAIITSQLMLNNTNTEANCVNVIPYNINNVSLINGSRYTAHNNFNSTRFITGYNYEMQASTTYRSLLSTESTNALLTTSNYILTGVADMAPPTFNPKRWQLIAGVTSQTIDYQYPPGDKDSGVAEDAIESGTFTTQSNFLLFADVDGAPQWVAPSNINF